MYKDQLDVVQYYLDMLLYICCFFNFENYVRAAL